MYSAELLDHFQNPRHVGEIPDPDASVEMQNPACGDVLRLTLRLIGSRIAEARFLAKGCVPAMAMGSVLTSLLIDRTVAEARQLTRPDLISALGGLPPASNHASHLAIDTLQAALKQLQERRVIGIARPAKRFANLRSLPELPDQDLG